jgi:hypothetical protein
VWLQRPVIAGPFCRSRRSSEEPVSELYEDIRSLKGQTPSDFKAERREVRILSCAIDTLRLGCTRSILFGVTVRFPCRQAPAMGFGNPKISPNLERGQPLKDPEAAGFPVPLAQLLAARCAPQNHPACLTAMLKDGQVLI